MANIGYNNHILELWNASFDRPVNPIKFLNSMYLPCIPYAKAVNETRDR